MSVAGQPCAAQFGRKRQPAGQLGGPGIHGPPGRSAHGGRYFVSRLPARRAKTTARATRSHWGLENQHVLMKCSALFEEGTTTK